MIRMKNEKMRKYSKYLFYVNLFVRGDDRAAGTYLKGTALNCWEHNRWPVAVSATNGAQGE